MPKSIPFESVEFFFETTIFEENESSFLVFENGMKCIREDVLGHIRCLEPQSKEKVMSKCRANYVNDIQFMCDKNKELAALLQQCKEKLANDTKNAEEMKKDQALLMQEVKDTHEAFLMAKSFYKTRLKMYFDILDVDKQGINIILIQFFTDCKLQNNKYSATFKWDEKSGNCELQGTTPKLQTASEISEKLRETNDISGALCCIRNAFKAIRSKENVK